MSTYSARLSVDFGQDGEQFPTLASYEESLRRQIDGFFSPLQQVRIEERVTQAYNEARCSGWELLRACEKHETAHLLALRALQAEQQLCRITAEIDALSPKFLAAAERISVKAIAWQLIKAVSAEDGDGTESILEREYVFQFAGDRAQMTCQSTTDIESLARQMHHASVHILWANLRSGDVVIKDEPPRTGISRGLFFASRPVRRFWDEGFVAGVSGLFSSPVHFGVHLAAGRLYHTGVVCRRGVDGKTTVHQSHMSREYEDDELLPTALTVSRFFRLNFARLVTAQGREAIARKTGVCPDEAPGVAHILFEAIIDRLHEDHRQSFEKMQLSLTKALWAHVPLWRPISQTASPTAIAPASTFCSEHVACMIRRAFEVFAAVVFEGEAAEPLLISPFASYDPERVTPSLVYEILRPYADEVILSRDSLDQSCP